jgi:hypothetical protein
VKWNSCRVLVPRLAVGQPMQAGCTDGMGALKYAPPWPCTGPTCIYTAARAALAYWACISRGRGPGQSVGLVLPRVLLRGGVDCDVITGAPGFYYSEFSRRIVVLTGGRRGNGYCCVEAVGFGFSLAGARGSVRATAVRRRSTDGDANKQKFWRQTPVVTTVSHETKPLLRVHLSDQTALA